MNRDLLAELAAHTKILHEQRLKNEKTNKKKTASKEDEGVPARLSAEWFLPNHEPIFMSIHDQQGNAHVHYHDFFEINYVINGSPVGVIDGQEIFFKPGNLTLMNPNAVHYYSKYVDDEDIILNIVMPIETFRKAIYIPMLSDARLNAFFTRYRVEHQSSYIYLDALDSDIESIIEMLIREFIEKKSYSNVIIESQITLLFFYIMRYYGKNTGIGLSTINEILNDIYQHYNDCSLENLAASYGYHPKYLSSLVKKHTGQSYRQLLVGIKLQNAAHYLIYSELSVEEIVERIGYKDKSSFYQSFKKNFGRSPGQFRYEHSGE